MRSYTKNKQNKIIIGILCAVMLLMSVGYAAFSSILNITGTSQISSNWDVRITNIVSKNVVGGASNAEEPSYDNTNGLTATFKTNLVLPGDSIEYDITITNNGTLNAKLDKIILSEPDNEYVTFETSGITEGDKLNAGSNAVLTVKVTFKDVTISKSEPSSSSLTVTIDYSQVNVGDDGISFVPASSTLTETIVTTGDGLYEDEIEAGRYIYRGANPNNYIQFNNELWRILSVEPDGTLKIMKNDSIGAFAWDRSNSNNWARPTTLNTYLNNDYYNTLLDESKDLIQTHDWGIGAVTRQNTNLVAQIEAENSVVWNGNVGLISVSEFLKANSNISQCGNVKLQDDNKELCKLTNYIFTVLSGRTWMMSARTDEPSDVWNINEIDNYAVYNWACDFYEVMPVVYLKSNITISGSGTETEPYIIN